ncbi:FAD binding domain-containing protein [Extibacter muris]|uniref:FAD binding domain-containing protein n=1 Tax=Extibacter muris TaxID=1796622 RepID=UPI001D0697FD|nr:xanthine dehydrogenase family protein subunit M [Extibacter muris]MCB6202280.1 xanthine dehydrogenase family protein subunit M [Extibacter muris]MCQ4665148.1 xanthine dehydrogenase family protein subunit M [Extibacter muris]MCQ4694512.1 xanthine dehydrogenase family protein subunit M [Extibacter muris]
MFRYNYYRAETLQDVCRVLAKQKDKVRILAGGTDLLVQIREQDKKWKDLEAVLDITMLDKELRYIKEDGDKIRIGALSTHTDIETSPILQKFCPFLSVASSTVGSPQIRNRGTIGGSICNASPAADPLTPLIAMDAAAVIMGVDGEREILLKDFYLGKGATDLKDGEFVKEFAVNKLQENAVTTFVKLGRRKALAISRMNVSVILCTDETGMITDARISPGCIFIVPDRVTAAEQAVIGYQPSKELFAKAGKAVSDEMIKRTGIRWSTEYKQPVIEGLVEEALLKAAGMED